MQVTVIAQAFGYVGSERHAFSVGLVVHDIAFWQTPLFGVDRRYQGGMLGSDTCYRNQLLRLLTHIDILVFHSYAKVLTRSAEYVQPFTTQRYRSKVPSGEVPTWPKRVLYNTRCTVTCHIVTVPCSACALAYAVSQASGVTLKLA